MARKRSEDPPSPVPCGYQVTPDECSKPKVAGRQKIDCANCEMGTQQARIAIANKNRQATPCAHNQPVPGPAPAYAWQCALCGHVYGEAQTAAPHPLQEA